ncbi:N-acetylmuramoyl-L-alanine amidase [[Eubacterium] hominis]|uniref:N-acetylmuramoyl-L-alanine amidase n=1 Tax=[Eubacterium] hominis TaxID=2764325 RepID=UPI003A4E02F0
MRRKTYVMIVALVATVCASTFMLSHIQHINALRDYKALSGVSVVLDPGHGGKDDGARTNDAKEQEINLKIAEKLKLLLSKDGASVTMTRDGAYDLASEQATNRKKEDMKKRVEMINQDQTDLFLSIHLNAYPNPSVKGAQAFYKKDNEVSRVFADIVQKNFKKLTGTKMTSKTGDYYILNNTNKIGALVECGFLSNEEDREKLKTEEYQQKVAQCLYESVLEYFQMLA